MVNASNTEAFKAKFEEAMKDEEFVKSLLEMEEPEEVRSAFAKKDIDVTVEEITQLRDALVTINSKSGELTEDDLEDVSGGIAFFVGVMIACGVGALLAGGAMGVGLDQMARARVRW